MHDNGEVMLQYRDPSLNSPWPLPSWKILVKSQNLSEPQLSPPENQDQNPYADGGAGGAY